MRGGIATALSAALVAACAVGSGESDTSFGGPGGFPPPGTGDGADDGDDDDTGSGGGETSGGSTSALEGGSSDGDDDGPPGGSTSDGGGSTTDPSTGGDGGGMQPDTGMYADCLMAAQCVGNNTCITILDTDMNPTDGFCSNNGCTDPAMDCQPSPGGTATPFCMDITLNGNPDTACALDCSGNKTCPLGMMCYTLPDAAICA